MAEIAPAKVSPAKVARKLYLTALCLSLLWAVGVLLERVVPDAVYLSVHQGETFPQILSAQHGEVSKGILVAFLPVFLLLTLRRWFRWLAKP